MFTIFSIALTRRATMEAVSDSVYNDLYPQIKEGLERIESKPSFYMPFVSVGSRLKTVEVSMEILKNGERANVSKTLYQHEWSCWKDLLLPLYRTDHYFKTSYSREKAQQLIKKTIHTLVTTENLAKENIVNCAIKVNTADQKVFAWDYWFGYKDAQENICSYTFAR